MPRVFDTPAAPFTTEVSAAALAGEPSFLGSFTAALCHAPFAHRDKNTATNPFFACVARPVGRKEIESTPAAQEAMRTEWGKLEANGVFDMAKVQEWHAVRARARRDGATIHHGSLATIVVEKNSELPEDDASRKYKGRTVFLGDRPPFVFTGRVV